MRHVTIAWLLGVTLASLACAAPRAQGAYQPYSVRVEDARGRPLRSFRHEGQLFVLGDYGERYVIRVENHTDRRVEAVVTVDGRDVLSGQLGDYRSQRGYLVDPHDSLRIEGFRRDLGSVAAFRFTSPGDAYTSRMGSPQHVGVIGAAFFPERVERPVVRRERASSAAAPAEASMEASGGTPEGAAPAPAPRAKRRSPTRGGLGAMADADDGSRIGTQYGERRESHVHEVRFRRQHPTSPRRVVSLRYDDAKGLRARGIRVHPPRPVRHARAPQAFPASRFAPPPP